MRLTMSNPISSFPGRNVVQLTTSNSVNFAEQPRGIIVTAGAIVFVNEDDTTTSIADGVLATGVVIPIAPKRINATGTTATIYGVY
jgi:hypothetical protein